MTRPTDLEHYLAIGMFNNLDGVDLGECIQATKATLEWMREYHPALLPLSENEPHSPLARN